ncbi:MAG: ATP-binding cassette domain-containing protein [Armatimonadetes bacterium]|nr:ATP-binding cassette domain-containing protein [Armatimonadota bacterium]
MAGTLNFVAGVSLRGVTKRFGDVTAVENLSLEVNEGEFAVLVGPSGCGKTTALRLIAGLEELTAGEITIGGRVVNDVPPKDRDIAMVFQSYALYPHMNVFENMSFGLRIRLLRSFWWRMSHPKEAAKRRERIESLVRKTARLLGLEDLLRRRPRQLSGGERQRVALGRAIVREPQVFLMDEPLSNLDAKLRVQMRSELMRLHRQLGITTVYVTHDQVEAMTMGDRIAVLKGGVLQQYATPDVLYRQPANAFVGSFIGTPPMNQLEAEVRDGVALVAGAELPVPDGARSLASVLVGIRPEAFRPQGPGVQLKPKVDVVEPLGATKTVYLRLGESDLTASLRADVPTPEGAELPLWILPEDVHFFDPGTGDAIR